MQPDVAGQQPGSWTSFEGRAIELGKPLSCPDVVIALALEHFMAKGTGAKNIEVKASHLLCGQAIRKMPPARHSGRVATVQMLTSPRR